MSDSDSSKPTDVDASGSAICSPLPLTEGERWATIHALNDHIVEIQKTREQFGLPIDRESFSRQYPELMSVMDKLLYRWVKPS